MLDNIPSQLKAKKQFLVWKLVTKKGYDKPLKIPHSPFNYAACSATEKNNYADFQLAKDVYIERGFTGIGFGLFSDITVIDFDNVLDPVNSELLPQFGHLAEWIEKFGSYTEKSISGRGLHIFCIAQPAYSRTRKASCPIPVEIYSKDRYIAMTGNVWHGYNEIKETQSMLDIFYEFCFGADQQVVQNHKITIMNVHTQNIFDVISKSKSALKFNSLFNGISCGDSSADDLAIANILAFYTKDLNQIKEIMYMSKLQRDKWEQHKTYLDNTIKKAIDECNASFSWIQKKEFPVILPTDVTKKEGVECEERELKGVADVIRKIKRYMEHQYRMYKNEVNGYTYINFYDENIYCIYTDTERSQIILNIHELGVKISDGIFDHIIQSNFVPMINPIADYFSGLDVWDGKTDYIEEYIHASLEFSEFEVDNANYITKWLIGVVACATSQKNVNDLCLILKGKQGIGKSTWLKNLLPPALSDYYSVFRISEKATDTSMDICSSLLLDMEELHDMSKREDSEIKSMISQKRFKFRKPYAHLPSMCFRYGSFCGSVNDDTFLKDSTGSRRFLVVNVDSFNFDIVKQYDKNKIWMQAKSMYESGYPYWMTQDDNTKINMRNQKYDVINAEYELLSGSKFIPCDLDASTHRLNATEILQRLDFKKLDYKAVKNMKAALKLLGFSERVVKKNGKSQRCYLLQEV